MPETTSEQRSPPIGDPERADPRTLAIGAAVVAVGALAVVAWVRAHHAREVLFNYWDARVYYGIAADLSAALKTSLSDAWNLVRGSLRSTHNALYAIPLALGYRVVGESWLSYKLLVTLLFHVPAAVALGLLGSVLATRRRLLSFCLVFGVALTLPSVWKATVSYYPDVAALLALVAMPLCYWIDGRLSRRALAAIAVSGAVAVLLRRHFVFPVVSVFVALSVVETLAVLRRDATPRDRARDLSLRAARLAASAAGAFALMYVVAPRYTAQFFANYSTLYTAYRVPFVPLVERFAADTGAVTTALAAVGVFVAVRTGWIARSAGWFIASFAVAWAALWWVGAGYGGPQYALHVFPLVQALGIGLGSASLLALGSSRGLVLGAIVPIGVALRFALGPFAQSETRSVELAFGPYLIPNRAHARDLASYRALLEELRRVAGNGKRVYVAASSTLISDAIVKSVDESFPAPGGERLDVIRAAHVDTRDTLPVPELLTADVIVVARPTQYHLAPKDQEVVDGVVRLMADGSRFAAGFTRVPRTISFATGPFEAEVFVRDRPTDTRQAIDALQRLVGPMDATPGGQGPWVVTSPTDQQTGGVTSPTSAWVYFESGKQRKVDLVSVKEYSGALLLESRVRISKCAAATASIGLVSPDGTTTPLRSFDLKPPAKGASDEWRVPVSLQRPSRLLISFERSLDSEQGCAVYLADVRVVPTAPR
jgi:hypothetical protein